MTASATVPINNRWPLALPDHRAKLNVWPWWERERLAAMWLAIRPGDMVVDVGAEEGDLPALWATWGADVALIEPDPRVWPNIHKVFDLNRLPRPAGAFCGFAGTDDDIHRGGWPTSAPDRWPDCAHGPVIDDHGFLHLNERPDCPVITLDTFAGWLPRPPTVLTVDVEGAELKVMLGADRVLRNDRPTVFVSVHPEFMRDRFGDTPDDLHTHMHNAGYDAHHLAFDHEYHWVYKPRPPGAAR